MDQPVGDGDQPNSSRSWLIALTAVCALTLLAVALVAAGVFDGDEVVTSSTSVVTSESATSTEPSPTTAPADPPLPPVDPVSAAIFPTPGLGTTYTDPVVVAREFALAIGYADVVTGEFEPRDARSGEVEIRPETARLPSAVLVAQLDDHDGWYVVGAATPNVEVDTPEPLRIVTSPLEVAGRASAFEGTVNVRLLADGATEPLVDDIVTGNGGPELGPFEGTFEFEAPDADGGALLFLIRSSKDGSVVEVGALRVFFDDA